jgi:hypothetical protein
MYKRLQRMVACEHCGAAIGAPCIGRFGRPIAETHTSRKHELAKWRKARRAEYVTERDRAAMELFHVEQKQVSSPRSEHSTAATSLKTR